MMTHADAGGNPVDVFLARQYPILLTAFIDYLDALRDSGQVITLEELRADLVQLVQHWRERSEENLT